MPRKTCFVCGTKVQIFKKTKISFRQKYGSKDFGKNICDFCLDDIQKVSIGDKKFELVSKKKVQKNSTAEKI